MARKGQFKKGGGRVGSRHARKSASTRTIVRTRTVKGPIRYRAKPHRKAPRRRKSGGGMGTNLLHLGLATAALSYATNDQGPEFIRTNAAKIPGATTFGAAAAVGGVCLAIDRFVKPNKWLKLFGVAGVVLAAAQAGKQGTNFKWVGDDEYTGDVGDDDDVGCDDDDDDEGDD